MGGYYRMLLRAMPGGRLGITVRRWGLCKVRKEKSQGWTNLHSKMGTVISAD